MKLKIVLIILITAIIFTGVGVYAVGYLACDISFIPTNENFKKENGEAINNVEYALNELYLNSGINPKESADLMVFNTSCFNLVLNYKGS